VCLESLPLCHQIADLPHQCLVAIDDLLGRVTVVVEPGLRDGRFERLDLAFALRDPPLEVGNPALKRLGLALLLAALGFEALALLARLRPLVAGRAMSR
jgi:hypothetical protein